MGDHSCSSFKITMAVSWLEDRLLLALTLVPYFDDKMETGGPESHRMISIGRSEVV